MLQTTDAWCGSFSPDTTSHRASHMQLLSYVGRDDLQRLALHGCRHRRRSWFLPVWLEAGATN